MKIITIAAIALAATFAAEVPTAAAQDAPAQAAAAEARDAIAAALHDMAAAKLAVSEQYSKTRAWAHDAAAAGFAPPPSGPARVVVADGTITATFEAPAALAGTTLQLVPSDTGDGMVHWRCDASALPEALKPKGCA